jgi:subtilisin family serine protease
LAAIVAGGLLAGRCAASVIQDNAASSPTWVFLKDKGYASPPSIQQALAQTQASLNPHTLQRRQLRGDGPVVDATDLPVCTSYVSSVLSSGATLRQESTWLNAISIQATPRQLAAISSLPFVDHVQPVARFSLPAAISQPQITTAPQTATGFYGSAETQLAQIHIPEVHALGYTGQGIIIGMLDTGFKRTHEAFNTPGHPINVIAEHDFINNTNDTSGTENSQYVHGTQTLSVIGAYKPNTYVGAAYNASFVLAKTEVAPTETQIEEDYWVAGLQFLESHGVDVVSSSLGYIDWYSQSQLNGQTAVTTLAANAATARGLPIVNSAGNEGHDANPATSHLIAPADGTKLITVGAVDSGNLPASFTSDGPTADGRLKPEVMAPGVGVSVLSPDFDTLYATNNGTSFSAPLVAATVALLIEAHPDWTVDDIRDALFRTASNAGSPDPLYISGYGTINAYAAILIPEPGTLGLVMILVLALPRRWRRST